MSDAWLDEIRWTADGLVPVIAQQANTGKILMFYRRFKKAGGELYFKSPLTGAVKDVFEELKLDKLLKAFS